MIIDWFNTTEAAILGAKIADDLSAELAKSNKKSTKKKAESIDKALQNTFTQVKQYIQQSKPNFYKKSKLVNEFKWRLLEIGHTEEFVDDLTKQLLLNMS